MKKLRRIIRQSFVNPIIDFLPLLAFNIVDNFWGLQPALYTAFPLSIYLSFYFFIKQPLVFHWHSFASSILLTIGFIVALLARTLHIDDIRMILVEIITAGVLVIILGLKEKIKKILLKNTSTLPMENNIDEFFGITSILVVISLIHTTAYLLLSHVIPVEDIRQKETFTLISKCVYTAFLLMVMAGETIRVYFIRRKLFQEDWWPIVNREGAVIGSVEKVASLTASSKYMHPVVRIAIMCDNKLLLRRRGKQDEFFGNVWDNTVSEHMKYGESIEACLERALQDAIDFYDVKKAEFKFSYVVESRSDNEVMFFFVIKLSEEQDFSLAKEYGEELKWWTTQQIDDNLGLKIFAEPFMREYPYLHHKGLIGKTLTK